VKKELKKIFTSMFCNDGIEKTTFWHENGQIRGERIYIYKDGIWKTTYWYKNGQIESESNWKYSIGCRGSDRYGKSNEWYKNGQIKSELNYKNGVLDGIQKWWHENGQTSERTYKDGDCISGDC